MVEIFTEQFSYGLFFWLTLVFFASLLILKKYAWKPILSAVKEREETIINSLEEAKKARAEVVALQADNDRILREARVEREAILKQANDMKNSIIAEAKEKAQEVASKEVEMARAQIHTEKMAAQTTLKNEVASLSIQIAEKVLRGQLDDKTKQEELVNTMIQDLHFN